MPAILNMAAKPKARSGHANAVMQAGGAADNMLSKNRASKARGECGNATSSRGMMRSKRRGLTARNAAQQTELLHWLASM